MSYIQCNENLLVNVEKIGEQHKHLFILINDLHEKMKAGQGNTVLKPIVASLIKYVIIHFSTEEKYMRDHDYPEFEQHKKEHDGYLSKTKEFAKKYKDGAPLLAREILMYLKDWYNNHIMQNDVKMGKYLNDKGLSSQ